MFLNKRERELKSAKECKLVCWCDSQVLPVMLEAGFVSSVNKSGSELFEQK